MAKTLQNRWFHRPKLHRSGDGEERKVGWLELFYDLIYVAAIIQLGNALSEHVGLWGFIGFFGVMAPIWLQWTSFTFYSNRFVVDDALHRVMVFVQMLFVGAVAVCVPYVFDGQAQGFALAYAGARLMLVAFYLRTWLQTEEARDMTLRYAIGFSVGALLWLASAFIEAPWCFAMWGLAVAVDLATPLSARSRELAFQKYPPDVHHLTERYGLLTIIVLGESFVKVLTAVAEQGLDFPTAMMSALALAVTCFLWWLYFDDIGGSRIKRAKWAPFLWIYTHLPFTVAVVAVGVALKKAVFFPPLEAAPDKYRWLLCGTVALALLAASVLDLVTERRQAEVNDRFRVSMRAGAAFFVLLLVPIGAGVSAWLFLSFLAGVCILQVIVDLLGAPLAADPESVHHGTTFGAPITDDDQEPETRPVRDLSEAVRKGTPAELRRDLYFHLMEGSWTQLIAAMIVLYLLSNAVFAGLFLIVPGGVAGLQPNDFWGAFAFSVQTMATIGYGVMHPQTGWADFLVTVEAGTGLLGVAVATGVIFAKIARPHSSVLFSDQIVITHLEGKETLMFRVGNARGNEVVEATMHVAVLCDEVTPEGHRFRRLRDLELVRNNTPIFTLTWSAMHILDETSPLYGLSRENLDERIYSIVVTMTGFDSTYAQTTHARHLYRSGDIQFGRRFVDVISTLDDGRMLVDYDNFHLTIPDEDPDSSSSELPVDEEE